MDEHFKKQLRDFFLIFGAENSLNETQVEKLQRSLDNFEFTNVNQVKKVSEFVMNSKLLEAPEEDVVAALKNSGLV